MYVLEALCIQSLCLPSCGGIKAFQEFHALSAWCAFALRRHWTVRFGTVWRCVLTHLFEVSMVNGQRPYGLTVYVLRIELVMLDRNAAVNVVSGAKIREA